MCQYASVLRCLCLSQSRPEIQRGLLCGRQVGGGEVANLAVDLAAPQRGLDDVEQRVREALALPHAPPRLLSRRADVPVTEGAKVIAPANSRPPK